MPKPTRPSDAAASDEAGASAVPSPEPSPMALATLPPEPAPALAAPPELAPAAPPAPTKPPYTWAKEKSVDLSIVAGAAVLVGWPAGNLKEGSLVVSEADFDAAIKAFYGMEIG